MPSVVWHEQPEFALVDGAAVARLVEAAAAEPLRRARICLHRGTGEPIQEMVVALARGCYIPPHRHGLGCESLHVMAGEVLAAFFDEEGRVTCRVRLGAPGAPLLYRLASNRWHTVLALSDTAVFHEVVQGPFDPARTVLAPWAPTQGDGAGAEAFLARVLEDLP